jgi:uncharacterized protein (TIGR00251 family)
MMLIVVRVFPRSRLPGVEKERDGTYRIRVSAPPEKGRANREMISRLADHMRIPPSKLKIVKGEKSSRKTVLIEETIGVETGKSRRR